MRNAHGHSGAGARGQGEGGAHRTPLPRPAGSFRGAVRFGFGSFKAGGRGKSFAGPCVRGAPVRASSIEETLGARTPGGGGWEAQDRMPGAGLSGNAGLPGGGGLRDRKAWKGAGKRMVGGSWTGNGVGSRVEAGWGWRIAGDGLMAGSGVTNGAGVGQGQDGSGRGGTMRDGCGLSGEDGAECPSDASRLCGGLAWKSPLAGSGPGGGGWPVRLTCHVSGCGGLRARRCGCHRERRSAP